MLNFRYDYSLHYALSEARSNPVFTHRIVVRHSATNNNHPVEFRENYLSKVLEWLNENIGQVTEDWHFSNVNSTFYFKEKESSMAFLLRWS